MLTLTLTIGVAVSLLLTELTGLVAGGIVVPGYVAMILDRPRAIAGLALLAGATWAIVRLLSDKLMLFGSRRFAVTILVGLVLSTGAHAARLDPEIAVLEWAGLGYVVPGLIAHHWERQGPLATFLMIAIAAPLTRLLATLAVRWLG